jgi:methyl-accepting chemotaxis protein
MNTWTIPRRIAIGFLTLVLLSLILGGIGLWRVRDINTSVTSLAANSVPSVVMLNKIIQRNNGVARAVRQLVEQSDNEKIVSAAKPLLATQRKEGDQLCDEYKKLLSDAEDERLFLTAIKSRDEFLAAADKAIELVETQKQGEGVAFMRGEVDSALDRTVAGFNNDIDYNIELAEKEAALAQRKVASSLLAIGATLALAGLLGTLMGWTISRTVTKSLSSLSDALQEGATQTAAASGQLSSASQSLASGSSQQASSVAETSAALEEMSVMIRSTAENAERAKDFANQARAAAQSGSLTMSEMNTAMQAIEASSAEVAKIVKNIDEIAFQTNILALNAAVEAARAGEAGAGFAVVADEVRSLAQRSAAAAKETAEKIEAAIANSRRGSASCGKVGESLDEIVAKVTSADALVAEIATAAKEQAQGIQQVGLTMTQMDKVTQSNAANAEESASAAEELNAQARSMQESVETLRSLVSSAAQPYQGVAKAVAPHGRGRRTIAPPVRVDAAASPRRSGAPQIPMPEDKTSADQDDRHFANF